MDEVTGQFSAENTTQTHILFRRFLEGDDSAFDLLYELHNQKIYGYCVKILSDSAAAQDITHSLWENIFALRGQSPKIRNPLGFLLRAARNLCINHLKHIKYQQPLDQLAEIDQPVIQDELTLTEEIVIASLGKLPDETREIMILHYYSGYTFEEIAEMLGKSPNAIWTRVSRARAKLKTIITSQLRKAADEE